MSEKRIDVVVRTGSSKSEVDSLDKSMTDLGKSADKTSTSLGNSTRQMTKMKPAAAGVNKALSGVGRSAGQAGIQIQQFVGQIQGGQSAMLALSQQGADLGFVLGAPLIGAVVGIGASLIGMALSSNDAEDAIRDLTDEVIETDRKFREIGQRQRQAVIQKIVGDIEAEQEKLGGFREDISDVEDDIKDMSSSQFGEGPLGFLDAFEDAYDDFAGNRQEREKELVDLKAQEEAAEMRIVELYRKKNELQTLAAGLGSQFGENALTEEEELRLQLQISQASYEAELQAKFDFIDASMTADEAASQKRTALAYKTASTISRANSMVNSSYMQSGNLVLSTLNNLVGGSEKAATAIKIAQGGMAAYMVYSNYQAAASAMLAPPPLGLGPLAGAGPAAALSSAGKLQAGLTFAAATSSALSGSSVSAPSVANPNESLVSQGSTGQPVTQPTTTRTIDVRLDDNALLTGSTVKEIIGNILSNDEDTVVEITSQQNNLKRIGAI